VALSFKCVGSPVTPSTLLQTQAQELKAETLEYAQNRDASKWISAQQMRDSDVFPTLNEIAIRNGADSAAESMKTKSEGLSASKPKNAAIQVQKLELQKAAKAGAAVEKQLKAEMILQTKERVRHHFQYDEVSNKKQLRGMDQMLRRAIKKEKATVTAYLVRALK
jgi:hypothetical protein